MCTGTRIGRDLFWMITLAMVPLTALACGSSGSDPEEVVLVYYETITDEDIEKQISLAVPKRREQIRVALTRFGFPPGSYANVKVETRLQNGDTATVASNYELTTTFQGKTVQGPVEEILKPGEKEREVVDGLTEIFRTGVGGVLSLMMTREVRLVAPRCSFTMTRLDHGPRG